MKRIYSHLMVIKLIRKRTRAYSEKITNGDDSNSKQNCTRKARLELSESLSKWMQAQRTELEKEKTQFKRC